MLENPEPDEKQISRCLRDNYGLRVEAFSRLSLGADSSTSVYSVMTTDQTYYFVKVKKRDFYEASVVVPNFLSSAGIKHVIPALATQTGQFWVNIDPFTVILYPFVEGQPAFEERMPKQQWSEYGAALRQIHTSAIPVGLAGPIQKESFFPKWCNRLRNILGRLEKQAAKGTVGLKAVELLKSRKEELLEIVRRAEWFAHMLREQHLEFVLCHADIHGWNLFNGKDGTLYIVDWDAVIFAPKERDLMFIGGGHGDSGYRPEEEETMFYQGYGQTNINHDAIAYYRYDRIVSDIVDDYDLLFLSGKEEEEQKELLEDIESMFFPNGKIEMAHRSDRVFHGK